jgi:membrane-bound inhibitor of C-type lysozyme
MHIKDIKWNEVNRFSQLIALVVFVGVFALGFELGKMFEYHAFTNGTQAALSAPKTDVKPIADVTYSCDGGAFVRAVYRTNDVNVFLSDGRTLHLPQVISASGARYANTDESFVFWNKGTTAFVTEGTKTTFANCSAKPIPN